MQHDLWIVDFFGDGHLPESNGVDGPRWGVRFPQQLDLLRLVGGRQWTGMGIGEADGWWMSSHADQMLHINSFDRAGQYEQWADHFEWRMLQYDAPVTTQAFTAPHGAQWAMGGLTNTLGVETSQAGINA